MSTINRCDRPTKRPMNDHNTISSQPLPTIHTNWPNIQMSAFSHSHTRAVLPKFLAKNPKTEHLWTQSRIFMTSMFVKVSRYVPTGIRCWLFFIHGPDESVTTYIRPISSYISYNLHFHSFFGFVLVEWILWRLPQSRHGLEVRRCAQRPRGHLQGEQWESEVVEGGMVGSFQ